jgi:hypothetical protein
VVITHGRRRRRRSCRCEISGLESDLYAERVDGTSVSLSGGIQLDGAPSGDVEKFGEDEGLGALERSDTPQGELPRVWTRSRRLTTIVIVATRD